MAQLQRIEGQIEIKTHADKFYNVWTQKTNLVSELCPDKFPKIELHEGSSWHSLGAINTYHFVANGRHEFVKNKVTEIDESSRSVSYGFIDGHILRKFYKTFKSKFQVTPKQQGEGCIVKWSFEYEKMNENSPDANIYIDFLLGVAKDMDARL